MTSSAAARQMLNLGCGHRLHPDFVNVDVTPRHPSVAQCDLSRGIPFPDSKFDVVYHSHVVEHLRRTDVLPFLKECLRVLKPGGILRVATPDLERLCESYLQKLRAVPELGAAAEADHEWLVIEMLDQAVREQSGGEMLRYLQQNPLPNEQFVLERIGEEGRELLRMIRTPSPPTEAGPRLSLRYRLLSRPRRLIGRVRAALVTSWYGPDALLAIKIGHFRLAGEVHHWLYDRLSLTKLLLRAGFREPSVRGATESEIPGWNEFHLDVTPRGEVTKPDSFFIEARRAK